MCYSVDGFEEAPIMPTTLQEKAAELLAKIDSGEGQRARLSPDDRALILRLGAKGTISQEQIAQAVGCSQATVSRVLQLLDTRAEARQILESGAARLAATVAATDDAAIALKALGKLDVVRDDRDSSHDSGVTIILGSSSEVALR
jgi:ParB-like chromosome segregation protein Spo0J